MNEIFSTNQTTQTGCIAIHHVNITYASPNSLLSHTQASYARTQALFSHRCYFQLHGELYTRDVFFRKATYTRARSRNRVKIKMQGLMIFQTWEFTSCCSPSADCVLLTGVHLGSVLGLSTSIDACAPAAEQAARVSGTAHATGTLQHSRGIQSNEST